MTRDFLGILLTQSLELVASGAEKVTAGDVIGNDRIIVTGTIGCVVHRSFPADAAALRETAAGIAITARCPVGTVAVKPAFTLLVPTLTTVTITTRSTAISTLVPTLAVLVPAFPAVAITTLEAALATGSARVTALMPTFTTVTITTRSTAITTLETTLTTV
ncbi:hypothetical protein, partial [uncultured Microbacterium sp.]|uniref:hypothetical protein n=1 Tax=uncultured Microbacterium sp. TaxID=191216 RepID=UPI00262D81F4